MPPPVRPACPVCGNKGGCPHCPKCLRDVSNGMHKATCPTRLVLEDAARLGCPACGGTGVSSRGGPCVPCVMTGRV